MKLFRRNKETAVPRAGRYSGRPDVFSYHASRSNDSISRGRTRPGTVQSGRNVLKILPTLIAGGVIVYSIGYLFMLETTPRVVILGGKDKVSLLQDESVYQKASQEILKGSILNRSKITINTETTAKHLEQRFPELRNVSITIPIASHKPVFELEPASPALILASSNIGPYVIDEQGRAVVKASDVAHLNELNLPKVNDESGLGFKLGESILPKEDVRFITEVFSQLSAATIIPEAISLPAVPNELHIRLSGANYIVKFDLSSDSRLQSGALIAAREELAAKNISPREYIDVRVKDKVFYK